MKNILLLAMAVSLFGCANNNAYLKGANSYHLCAALSENETIRNTKLASNYQFSDSQIKSELERRGIDPLGIKCGRVGAEYQHSKTMRELKQSRLTNLGTN